jgi:hypothetical protein
MLLLVQILILEEEICDCPSVGRSSKETNEEGYTTHGLIQGGCGLINRTVVFECGNCEELSASKKTTYVRNDIYHIYYCDDCQSQFELPPVDCSLKRCHNWPN